MFVRVNAEAETLLGRFTPHTSSFLVKAVRAVGPEVARRWAIARIFNGVERSVYAGTFRFFCQPFTRARCGALVASDIIAAIRTLRRLENQIAPVTDAFAC